MRKLLKLYEELSLKMKIISISSFIGIIMIIILVIINFFNRVSIETQGTIYDRGGTIIVNNQNSKLLGLELTIPEDAYSNNIEVIISSKRAKSVDFPDEINAISPLIIVDIGHKYSLVPMEMKIPIDIDVEKYVVMVFYYDTKTRETEAIPTTSLTNSEIVIQTKHFSSIVVSAMKKTEVTELASGDKTIDTGYTPGEDDWQFTNYGSSLAPGGHCAGQSLTSAYYYIEKSKASGESLWGLFDNDTPDFWYDDSDAYRYASVVQNAIDFTSSEYISYISSNYGDDSKSFHSFIYSMYVTGSPQFMSIYSHDDGSIVSGHALIAYKIVDNKVYVADPNYPGDDSRFVEFDVNTSTFGSYYSGNNAYEIDQNGETEFDTIIYMGLGALVNFTYLEYMYERMLDGTVGDSFMTTLEVDYMLEYNENSSLILWETVSDSFVISSDYNDYLPANITDKIVLSAYAQQSNLLFSVYKNQTLIKDNILPDGDYAIFDIPLESGVNNIGILVQVIDGDNLYYADYITFEYTYNGN